MNLDVHLMGWLQGEMISGFARSAAGALVSGLWQGALLCAVVGLLLRLVPKSTATLRFVVWMAVFGVAVVMPFSNLVGAKVAGPVGATGSEFTFDLRWSYALASLWIAASVYRLGQLLMEGFVLRALGKSASPVGAETLCSLNTPLLVYGRRVELCICDEVDRPSVIGFLNPRILIPSWLFEHLTAVELNHIVLHELEHLRRRDDWMNLLQKIGLMLLPLNPALFWIDRRLSTERELACDDGVLERTQMPKAYAASLASIAERRLMVQRHGRLQALALAATGLRRRGSELGERIESILGRRTRVSAVFASVLSGVFVAAVVAGGVALAHAPQLVSFGPVPVPQHVTNEPAAATPGGATSPVSSINQNAPTAVALDVNFRETTRARVRRSTRVRRKVAPAPQLQKVSQGVMPLPRQQQLIVLTSWENSPVSRVVVQTPGGRFFLAPYAAVPTQAGWLFVQL